MSRVHQDESTATRIDLEAVGDTLPALIERAAAAGDSLIIEKRGVRLATVVPFGTTEAARSAPVADEEAIALLGRMRSAFADRSEEEIVHKTAAALAEVRADIRTEAAVR